MQTVPLSDRGPVARSLVLTLITLLSLGAPSAAMSQPAGTVEQDLRYARSLSRAFQHVSEQVEPSVVHVTTFNSVELVRRDVFGRRYRTGRSQPQQSGLGSGVIMTGDGHILTNDHVVGSADRVLVRLTDRRELEATVVGRDPSTDLAVLKIDAEDLTPATFSDSDRIEVGEWVLAIGSPFGFDNSVTAGIVSAKGRSGFNNGDDGERYEEFIQTDAAINPGNSGGPLVNLDGRVVGINTQIVSRGGGNVGIGFAIPSKIAESVLKMIIAKGRTDRGWLGVNMRDLSVDEAEAFGIEAQTGVILDTVVDGGPADEAGLRAGDVIVSLNGERALDTNRIRNDIAFSGPGATLRFGIVRDQRRFERSATLIDQTRGRALAAGGTYFEESGLVVVGLTREIARQLGTRSTRGVVVVDIVRGSPADEAGLEVGDIIMAVGETMVASSADLERAVRRAGSEAELRVVRDGLRGTLTLRS